MIVRASVESDLARLPDDLRQSGLAATALVLAERLDDPETPATAVAQSARALLAAMKELRSQAPERKEVDGLDEISLRRASR